MDDEMAREH
jgi:2-polyprenyl-3-methyl-5-hydroxy-6-metoxy-1,4-benzoquinol methylase